MDWTALASVVLGWLGQHLKAYKQVPTSVTQAGLVAIGLAFYALGHPFQPTPDWYQNGIAWAFAILGVGSMAAGTGLAAKTDSK